MTIPNILTFARIALIPVLVLLLFLDGAAARWWALGLFIAMSLTDFLDGWLARKLNQQSALGALIDPIADKVLVVALVVALVGTGDMSRWDIAAAILILSREMLVSGLREFLAHRNLPLPVTRLAKWKTTAQLVALTLFLLPPLGLAQQDLVTSAIWWLAAILTLVTGFDYVTTARRRPGPEMAQHANVAGIVGWHNSGKTTLVVALVRELTARGHRVSTVKHAHHKFDVDTPGKDSWQHRDAGAAEVMVGSENRWALMHELRGAPEPDLDTLLSHMSPVDLILVEGFKSAEIDKIEVYRDGLGEPALALTDNHIVAVACATQIENLGPAVTRLNPDDVGSVADFIENHWSLTNARSPAQVEKT